MDKKTAIIANMLSKIAFVIDRASDELRDAADRTLPTEPVFRPEAERPQLIAQSANSITLAYNPEATKSVAEDAAELLAKAAHPTADYRVALTEESVMNSLYIFGQPVSSAQVAVALFREEEREAVSRILKQLVASGRVEMVGQRRGARYQVRQQEAAE